LKNFYPVTRFFLSVPELIAPFLHVITPRRIRSGNRLFRAARTSGLPATATPIIVFEEVVKIPYVANAVSSVDVI
jgi:hypothetical protein